MKFTRALIGLTIMLPSLVLGAGDIQAFTPSSSDPWRLCPQAIAEQEKAQAIPKHLLSAISLAESGRRHPSFGKRMPWPWTVMAEGEGRYLPSKAAAINEVRRLQARRVRNIDVGCMQVNLYHHADAFSSLDEAFDPSSNVAYAGQFLRDLFEDAGSWQEAAGRYHSATPEHKIPYRQKVVKLWNDQQRLEFAGAETFGEGPLTAGLDGGRTAGSRIRSPAMLLSLAKRSLGREPQAPVVPRVARPARALGARPAPIRMANGGYRVPARSAEEEAAFAARRTSYMQELRRAVAAVKRSYSVRVARNEPGGTDAPGVD
jgi:Transglycosylase SLT domain